MEWNRIGLVDMRRLCACCLVIAVWNGSIQLLYVPLGQRRVRTALVRCVSDYPLRSFPRLSLVESWTNHDIELENGIFQALAALRPVWPEIGASRRVLS
jgi:hypothetical protein